MFNPKYLVIASIQATKSKSETEEIINSLPGDWDIINLDGTLKSTCNKHNNENICDKDITRLAYIKTDKESHKDNRT